MRKIKSLKEIQDIEYDMLLYLKRISEKNGINLMLSGGTLLGAVRHKDFIPWDDDIDVMLVRKDYNRLINILKKDKNSNYKVITSWNTMTYPLPFAKLMDKRTYQKQTKELEIKGLGCSVDIFPIDVLPNDKKQRENVMSYVASKMNIIGSLRDRNYSDKIEFIEYWMKILLIRINLFFILFKMNSCRLKNTNYAAVIAGQYKDKEIMKKEEMYRTARVKFRDEVFLAPAGYKKYLSRLYGKNYMMMPPKTIQKPKHVLDIYWK